MENEMIIQIQVSEKTRKYLSVKYAFINQWNANWRTPEGLILYSLLEGKRNTSRSLVKPLNQYLSVRLFRNQDETSRFILSPESMRHFENFIHLQILNDAVSFIDGCISSGTMTIQDAICEFLYKYDFTADEISLETVRRHYHRKKEKPGSHAA